MRKVWSYQFRRTTLLLIGCVTFLSGVGIAHAGHLLEPWLLLLLTPGLIALRHKSWLALIVVVLFGLGLGWWRGSLYMQKLGQYDRYYYQNVDLQVTSSEDAVYVTGQQLTFTAGNIIDEQSGQRLAGKISVSGFGLNAVFQGDILEVSGKLYPTLGANQARLSFATLSFVKHQPSLTASIRRSFAAGMQTALPEPLASFAMGLLIGQRANLPDNVKQDLLMVGLTHIIAVSGYNLTIILQASKRLLAKRSKRLSTMLSLALIGVFLLLAGASASIVRAAVVSVLSIATAYYGRRLKPLLLIFLAAAITAYASPFYVWSDVSWYLSFLAFYGVLVVSPLIEARLPRRWSKNIVAAVAVESVSAEIMSLPIILFTFGQISFIGLLGNVFVTTLVPLAMLLAAIAGLAGALVPALCGWLAWPAQLLLTYMLDTAHLLSGVPHVFLQNLHFSLNELLTSYALIVALTTALWFKSNSKSDTITDISIAKGHSQNGVVGDEP